MVELLLRFAEPECPSVPPMLSSSASAPVMTDEDISSACVNYLDTIYCKEKDIKNFLHKKPAIRTRHRLVVCQCAML